VGKIIAKTAAETLTPVVLKLGGRNPAIVTKHADPALAARYLAWGKTLNAGQVCLSHNCAIVDRTVLPQFIVALGKTLKEFYPDGAKASKDFGRIVNACNFWHIKTMLDNTEGKVLIGGKADEDNLYIEPTVV
jgi:beta-apo-4'-carotenal oxygenase